MWPRIPVVNGSRITRHGTARSTGPNVTKHRKQLTCLSLVMSDTDRTQTRQPVHVRGETVVASAQQERVVIEQARTHACEGEGDCTTSKLASFAAGVPACLPALLEETKGNTRPG